MIFASRDRIQVMEDFGCECHILAVLLAQMRPEQIDGCFHRRGLEMLMIVDENSQSVHARKTCFHRPINYGSTVHMSTQKCFVGLPLSRLASALLAGIRPHVAPL